MPVAECICADDSIMKLPLFILIYQALLRIAVYASSNPFITFMADLTFPSSSLSFRLTLVMDF